MLGQINKGRDQKKAEKFSLENSAMAGWATVLWQVGKQCYGSLENSAMAVWKTVVWPVGKQCHGRLEKITNILENKGSPQNLAYTLLN